MPVQRQPDAVPLGNPNILPHLGHSLTLPSWIMWLAESSAVPDAGERGGGTAVLEEGLLG